MSKERLIIIGAGVTGLYAALLLQEAYDITLLEAREVSGGRVQQRGGHDMGPSWVWGHQHHILSLIESLGLELDEQYNTGHALYDSPEGVQRFSAPASAPSARIRGGISAMVHALEERVYTPILFNTTVAAISEQGDCLLVKTGKGNFEAEKVISTLPPRLAAQHIVYTPPLPAETVEQFKNTPTWMGYAAKCVIEFKEAFWKEEGLSGFAFSHLGPLGEIHDACTSEKAALFGFLHSTAKRENIETELREQLIRLYGEKASHPENIYLIDWQKEVYTSTLLDALPLREHPRYGFDLSHFGEKLIFSGTESAFNEGGYLEGAINAAKTLKEKLCI